MPPESAVAAIRHGFAGNGGANRQREIVEHGAVGLAEYPAPLFAGR
jgi:hypothetical protein